MISLTSWLVLLSVMSHVFGLSTTQNLTLTEVISNNTSLNDTNVDPRFQIHAEVFDYTMDSHSLYMNALGYMTALSQEDFTGVLHSANIISMEPWDDVVISLLPITNYLQRRHVLWGLYKGMDFARATGWHAVNLYLVWEGVIVGKLQLTSVEPASDKAGNITATCSNMTKTEINAISPHWNGKVNCINDLYSFELDSASNTARITLSPSYLSNARSLSADRVYNSMAGIMTYLAEQGGSNRLDNILWTESDFQTNIDVSNLGPEGMSPRTFTNGMTTKAMWKMAVWIGAQNRYDECKTQVKLSGRTVGRIDITAEAAVT